jgi:hypothetical protein
VRHFDALARATGIEAVDVLAWVDSYRRARGRGRGRLALDLMDGGAPSPKKTALRSLVIDEGLMRDFCGLAPRSTSRTASTPRSSTWGGTALPASPASTAVNSAESRP